MGSNLGHGFSGIRDDFVGHGGSQDYVTNVMQQPLPEQQVESSHRLEFESLTLGFKRKATAVYGQDLRLQRADGRAATPHLET